MPLPRPDHLTSLILRTDFDDEGAWDAVCAVVEAGAEHPRATFVSDRRFAGAGVPAVLAEEAAADADDRVGDVFLADTTTMSDPERPLLAVDLSYKPGRTFRVPARWFPDVAAHLGVAQLTFADYADAADGSGTFRGFAEGR
ncbi:hypothetical protein AB0G79_11715 [Streptomyces sp. NPDC020807]|uniref:DUF6924 domain-containing protein n=1 Tax=Streptomyces sp. NPDC020807 TaxID=3155119 RepID=UPI0033E0992B